MSAPFADPLLTACQPFSLFPLIHALSLHGTGFGVIDEHRKGDSSGLQRGLRRARLAVCAGRPIDPSSQAIRFPLELAGWSIRGSGETLYCPSVRTSRRVLASWRL